VAPTNPTMRKVVPYPTMISIQSDPLHDHITTRGRRRNSYHRMSLEERFNTAPHSRVSMTRNLPLDARSTYSGQQYDTLTEGNTVDTHTSVLLPSSPTPTLPAELLNNIESCIQS